MRLEYKVLTGLLQVVGQRRSSRSREIQLLLVSIKKVYVKTLLRSRLELGAPAKVPGGVEMVTLCPFCVKASPLQ
jgi:hypothetical protein